MVDAPDRITVNAGGRLFETTTSTLNEAHYFRALLGHTGAALANGEATTVTPEATELGGTKRPRLDNDEVVPNKSIYIDCDPDHFSDVLYFMRRSKLPAKAALDAPRLEDIKTNSFGLMLSYRRAMSLSR